MILLALLDLENRANQRERTELTSQRNGFGAMAIDAKRAREKN